MKTIKIALYIILLPVLVIVVASGLFLATFDANKYKQELADIVKDQTGRTLTFEGDAELLLYPEFGMSLGAMQFSNAAGFGNKPMVSVDKVSISVDVQSVLMMQPKISQMILSELDVDLQKNKNGVTNWDDLIPKEDNHTSNNTQNNQKPNSVNTAKDGEKEFEIAGAFEGLNIKNAKVSWRDDTTGERINLDDLDLVTGNITPTEAFPISLHLVMHKDKEIDATVDLSSNIFFDFKKKHLSVDNLALQVTADGELIPVDELTAVLNGHVDLDLEKQLLAIPNLKLKTNTRGGLLTQSEVVLASNFKMNLESQAIDLSQLSLQLNAQDKEDIKAQANLISNIKYDLKQSYLTIDGLELNADAGGELIPVDKAKVALKAKVILDLGKQLLSVSGLNIAANTQGGIIQQSKANIAGDLNMNLADQSIKLSKLNINADVKDQMMPKGHLVSSIKSNTLDLVLPERKVDITQLQLAVNKILFTGDVHVKDYEQPSAKFNLSSKKIDLDELLGLNEKKETAEAEKETPDNKEVSEDDIKIALPTELLRSLELDGTLRIDEFKAMNVKTANNHLNVLAANGLVEIKQLDLDLYDGSLKNSVVVDVRGDLPKYQLSTNLNKVQIGNLLIDLVELDKIRGSSTVDVKLSTQGEWLKTIKKNLNGDVSLLFTDGAIKGLNLRHSIDVAKARLAGKSSPKEEALETDFSELSLSGKLMNGVFHSDDLNLKAPLIRVGGEGSADLNENSVDYTVNAKVIGSLEGQTGDGFDELGLLIPVRIYGPFTDIKTDVLYDNLLKQKAAKELEKTKALLKAKADKLIADKKAALKKQQEKLKAEAAAALKAKQDALKAQKAKAAAAAKAKVAAQKAKAAAALKAKQDALKAQKAKLAVEAKAKAAAQKAKLAAELKAKQDAAAKAAKEKAKKKLEDKLKGLF